MSAHPFCTVLLITADKGNYSYRELPSGLCWAMFSFASTIQRERESCPDSVEQIMLLSVARGVWSAEEDIRVRSMGCSHFYSAESSAGVADGEYQVWNSSLIAIKALKT